MYAQTTQAQEVERDDENLDNLLKESARALARSGLTVQDFLDELPTARAEVRRELYGDAYIQEIERRFAAYRQAEAAQATRGE